MPTRPGSNGHITVYVTLPKVFAQFRPDPCKRTAFSVDLSRGSTLGDLVTVIQMPADLPGSLFVNHRLTAADAVLPNGASVEIFPALGRQ